MSSFIDKRELVTAATKSGTYRADLCFRWFTEKKKWFKWLVHESKVATSVNYTD